MATNTLKVSGSSLTTGGGLTTVYTTPGSTQTTVLSLSVCNTHSAGITCDVTLSKGGATNYKICNGMTVALNATLVAIGDGQKLTLQAGDLLKVQTFTGPCDVVISYLEVT